MVNMLVGSDTVVLVSYQVTWITINNKEFTSLTPVDGVNKNSDIGCIEQFKVCVVQFYIKILHYSHLKST